MIIVRRYFKLIDQLEFPYHIKGWFLETALLYCQSIITLKDDLEKFHLTSSGLKQFTEYLNDYTTTEEFKSLYSEATKIKNSLTKLEYSVIVQRGKFSVRKYENEEDYTINIFKTFEKFRQSSAKDYRVNVLSRSGMNHIEAKILDFVVNLFPEPFAELDNFSNKYNSFIDDLIFNFDHEIQFYTSYLNFVSNIKQLGLNFCLPEISTIKEDIYNVDGFDIALAMKSLKSKEQIVINDFYFKGQERILVVSGPNQGGKTTFARMFGQLHYLAKLGCPIPGNKSKLFLSDNIFTHFEKEETITTLRGKLQDELVRIQTILSQMSTNSIIIINEIFTSTTLEDAIFLSKEILTKLLDLDVLCVIVTFIDELSHLNPKTVSMVSNIVPDNPSRRTFKILRKPADGLVFAQSIAKKHHLTFEQILERIKD